MKTPPQKRKTQSEMQLARGRLRGALTLQTEDDQDEDNGEEEAEDHPDPAASICDDLNLPQRGRPPKNLAVLQQSPRSSRIPNPNASSPSSSTSAAANKRRKHEQQAALLAAQSKIQAESFVMKLFDRSLDLSKYSEQTALYPICRAWMANQPRNPNIRSYRERRSPSPAVRSSDDAAELLAKLRRGEVREVRAMPAPRQTELPKIPPPPPLKVDNAKQADNGLGEKEKAAAKVVACSKDEMVAQWKQVKANWMKHTKRYQKRYELNHAIVQELFKP